MGAPDREGRDTALVAETGDCIDRLRVGGSHRDLSEAFKGLLLSLLYKFRTAYRSHGRAFLQGLQRFSVSSIIRIHISCTFSAHFISTSIRPYPCSFCHKSKLLSLLLPSTAEPLMVLRLSR